jgi:hypothetical protein
MLTDKNNINDGIKDCLLNNISRAEIVIHLTRDGIISNEHRAETRVKNIAAGLNTIEDESGFHITESSPLERFEYEEDHAGVILKHLINGELIDDVFLQPGDDANDFFYEVETIEKNFADEIAEEKIQDYIGRTYF